MQNLPIVISAAAAILAASSLTVSLKGGCPTKAASGVEQVLKDNPKIVADALQAYQAQQQAEAEKARQEALKQFAAEINSSENMPSVGPADAKVTVVEFFDFSCGYCKRLAPALEKVIAANSDVKFIFKPLTFVAPVSRYQAQAGMAVNNQGKFLEFYKAVMAAQGRMDNAAVDAAAQAAGVDMEKYKADINSESVNKAIDTVAGLAQKIQVNGVPSLMINGEHVQAYDEESIQNAINAVK